MCILFLLLILLFFFTKFCCDLVMVFHVWQERREMVCVCVCVYVKTFNRGSGMAKLSPLVRSEVFQFSQLHLLQF